MPETKPMNVLCIGYLDKHSRFFLDIKRQVNAKHKKLCNLKVNSIHLSGFIYTFIRFKSGIWLPLKAWLLVLCKKGKYNKIIWQSDIYRGTKYNQHISFHLALKKSISKKALQFQALAYIDVFNSSFNKFRPNVLLCIGDSRLAFKIAIAIAKQRKVTIRYIEKGPLGTTFFDDQGSNANLSIRNKANELTHTHTKSVPKKTLFKRRKEYLRSPFYRGVDFLTMFLFQNTQLYPPDIKYTDINLLRFNIKKTKRPNYNKKKQVVLLICQVPLDVNMIEHSPHYKSHTSLLKDVHQNLPNNAQLIVREHPLYISKYEKKIYTYMESNNIIVDSITPLPQALSYAKAVVVINSTVGVEAIFNYKTTVVLGNAFFDWQSICLKLNDKGHLKSLLQKAMNHKPNVEAIKIFKKLLFDTVLIQGSIKDREPIASKAIANLLNNEI